MQEKIIRVVVFLVTIFCSTQIFAGDVPQFYSAEHVYLGNLASIYFPVKVGDTFEYRYLAGADTDFRDLISTPLAKPLTFGKIVAAPDMFADPKNAIVDGKTLDERRELFNRSFNVFVTVKPTELDNVFAIMDDECKMVQDALAQGKQPSDAYKAAGSKFILRYFLADPLTVPLFFLGWDHIGKDAWLAYQAGHLEALNMALAGYAATDPLKKKNALLLAMAKEAYACHFLSDIFASGHMRTPFRPLANVMADQIAAKATTAVLALMMHDEDNEYGLQVENRNGDRWVAYGDKRYLDAVNAKNKQLLDTTLQKSIDEITLAFKDGIATPSDKFAAAQTIPNIDLVSDYIHYVNSPDKTIPMFVAVANKNDVLRRNDINMLHPKKSSIAEKDMKHHGGLTGWWGLTTLLELKLFYNPKATAPINYGNFASYLKDNGEVNDSGLALLASLLNPVEKGLFCADETVSGEFRELLRCGGDN